MKRVAPRGVLLAAVVALALPAVSLASPLSLPAGVSVPVPPQFRALVRSRLHSPPRAPSSVSRFDLKAQGYAVSVVGARRLVIVEVISDRRPGARSADLHLGEAVTAYIARGRVTRNRIEASFGEHGRIDVGFHPSGRVSESRPHRHCRGADRFTHKFGVFTGTIQFTGEDHYISVRAHRARGQIKSPARLYCASELQFRARRAMRPLGGGPGFTPTFLLASWREAVNSAAFLSIRGDEKALFLALTEQSKGSVAELRYALAIAPVRTFASNSALTSATVTPPWPFRGSGEYRAAPDGTKTWGGSLSVSFPGAAPMPFTGAPFKPDLTAGF